MKLKMFLLLIVTSLLAACGLGNVDVSVGEATAQSAVEPQVVTVIVVATSTPVPMEVSPSAPQPPAATAEPASTETAVGHLETDTTVSEAAAGAAATEVAATAGFSPPPLPFGSWQSLPDLPRYLNDLVADPGNPRLLYAGTGSAGSGSGVYKSEDGGLTWQLAADGLPSEDVMALALSSAEPPILYALVGVRGDIYASNDAAQSWSHLGNSGLFGGFEHWMQVDPGYDNVLLAMTKSGEFARSVDGGYTWLPFGDGLPRDDHSVHLLSLGIDPTDSNVIYAGTGAFVGGGRGVYKSEDGGQTWTAVNKGMLDYRITALAVDPARTDTVYAGTDDGVLFKTSDGGQTWADLSPNLPLPRDSYPAIRKIVFDSAGTIFLLADRAGVFVSPDAGETWQALGKPGEVDNNFSAMVVVSGTEPTLVIGARRDGCWRYGAE